MILVFAFVLVGCGEDYEFSIEAENETVEVGKSISVYADTNKPNPEFEFTSSDENIATVNEVGIVTGKSAGKVTITVKLKDVRELTVEITVIEKNLTPADLKNLLTTVLTEYKNALNGSIKVTTFDGLDNMVSETIFNYSAAGALESLMYKVQLDEEMHVYVKDGISYTLINGVKTKKTLTEQDIATIKNSYGHSVFLDSVTKFYDEDAFYSALSFVEKNGVQSKFSLDPTKYTGTVFNTEVDEFIVLVDLDAGKVTSVGVQIKTGDTTRSIKVEYRGIGKQEIDYPNDLDSYK
jgi:hypothetical protein